jgi:hypothetical protein
MNRITLAAVAMLALILTSGFVLQPQPTLKKIGESPALRSEERFNVWVVNNRLAFATIQDYERVVNEPTEELKTEFNQTVDKLDGFTSYGTSLGEKPHSGDGSLDRLIEDDFFKSILNADLAVQIGDNIFRVNTFTEKVYVLPVINQDQYDDLIAENTANKNIKVFSTGDDVLELIENNGQKICRQSGISGQHAGQFFGANKMASADFNKYGIYFSLSAVIAPQSSWPSGLSFDFTGGIGAGHIHYHVRCGSTADYEIRTTGYWTLITQRYQSYQGSTNLNELYMGYRVKSAGGAFLTPFIIIRRNW